MQKCKQKNLLQPQFSHEKKNKMTGENIKTLQYFFAENAKKCIRCVDRISCSAALCNLFCTASSQKEDIFRTELNKTFI